MTVKDLFNSLAFDELLAALRNTHRNERSIEDVASYKMAFDFIRHLQFKGPGGVVSFDVSPREEWFTPNSLPMKANNVEGDYWENTIGKTIVFPDPNPFTNAELAGSILWGMTFCGFDPEDKFIFDREWHSDYGRKAEELYGRKDRPYERKKEKSKSVLESADDVDKWFEAMKKIAYRKKHQNRIKRMRLHRIEKRIDYLERMDWRIGLLKSIRSSIGYERCAELDCKIMNAKSIEEHLLKSRACDSISRKEYLVDLADNYSPGMWDTAFDEAVVIVSTSPEASITEMEKEDICKYFQKAAGYSDLNLEIIYGNNNSPDNQMWWQILFIKQKRKHQKRN